MSVNLRYIEDYHVAGRQQLATKRGKSGTYLLQIWISISKGSFLYIAFSVITLCEELELPNNESP